MLFGPSVLAILICLLNPFPARVFLKKPTDSLFLTKIETLFLELSSYFEGDSLSYETSVSTPSSATASANSGPLILNKSNTIPKNEQSTSTEVLPSFVCRINSRCFVSFSERTVKVFIRDTGWGLLWSLELPSTVTSVATLDLDPDVFILAVTEAPDATVYMWDSDTFVQTLNFTCSEFANATSLTLRSSPIFSPGALAVGVSTPQQDFINVYTYWGGNQTITLLGAIDSYDSVPGKHNVPMKIVDFQMGSCLMVLDAEVGLICFYENMGAFGSVFLGMYPNVTGLGLSNIVDTTDFTFFAVWTSGGVFYNMMDWLSNLSFFPLPAALVLEPMTLSLHKEFLLAMGGGYLLLVKFHGDGFGFAEIIMSMRMPGARSYAVWAESNTEYLIVRDLEDHVEATSLILMPAILIISNCNATTELTVMAKSALGGSAQAVINLTSLHLDDRYIYYGSGYRLSTTPAPLNFSVSFTARSTFFTLSLDSLFSGLQVSYELLNYTASVPEFSSSDITILRDHYSMLNNSTMQFGPQGSPVLGCIADDSWLAYVTFSENYVVLSAVDQETYEFELRAVQIDKTPVMCVSNQNSTWVYATSHSDYSIYVFSITLDPLAISLTREIFNGGQSFLPPCLKLKLNSDYFMCVGQDAIVIEAFNNKSDNNLGYVVASRVENTLTPWILADAEFLSEKTAIVVIADVTNGVSMIDLKPSLDIDARLSYISTPLRECYEDTTLHYENRMLVIVHGKKRFVVYTVGESYLTFRKALPPLYTSLVDAAVLRKELLFVKQGTDLVIYAISETVHSSLYAKIDLPDKSMFLVFHYVSRILVLVMSRMQENQYNAILYEVYLPNDPFAFRVDFSCFECLENLPMKDIIFNATLAARNPWGGYASRQLIITFLNQGTFPAYTDSRVQITNVTIASTNSSQLELWEVFEGNDVTYSLIVNGESDFNDSSAPLTISESVQRDFLFQVNNSDCDKSTGLADRIFFLCHNPESVDVYRLPKENSNSLSLEKTFEVPVFVLGTFCETISAVGVRDSLVILAIECADSWSYRIWVMLYDMVDMKVADNTTQRITTNCYSFQAVNVSEDEYHLFLAAGLSSQQEESRLLLSVYSLTISGNEIVNFSFLTLLTPLTVDLPALIPKDFGLFNTNSSNYLLFIMDDLFGITMLEASDSSFSVIHTLSLAETFSLVGESPPLNIRVCGSRFVIIFRTHILVYTLQDSDWAFERVIYPYNGNYPITHVPNTAFCFDGNDSRFLALGATEKSSLVRIVDFQSPGKSHILADVEGSPLSGCGSFPAPSWFFFSYLYANQQNVTVLKISSPTLTVPALNQSAFQLLNDTWGNTTFQIQIAASNAQGTAVSPNVTLRRVMLHNMRSEGREVERTAPWVMALYVIFLIILAVLGLGVIRRQSKQLSLTAEDSDDELQSPILQEKLS